MRRATGAEADGSQGGDNESVRQAVISKLISFAKNLLFLGCGFFVFTLIFKNVRIQLYITFQFDNKNFMDNYKFDIKKAKDISARLDDVKGIDEIKEELENLIKMLKEPDRYH